MCIWTPTYCHKNHQFIIWKWKISYSSQISSHNAAENKSNLDNEVLKNYRHVANLPFLAKTVECTCACQIQEYLVTHKLREKMQSAYRPCYTTQTALLRAYNDLLLAVDKGNEAVLILLDYSAAFDTINYNFFQRLVRFGITGSALDWFSSYFEDRFQSLYVCLTGCSVRRHTWVLMGPDANKMLKPG